MNVKKAASKYGLLMFLVGCLMEIRDATVLETLFVMFLGGFLYVFLDNDK